jgi:hypothetical protein
LKIGDYIILRDVRLGCYLGAEGILLDDLAGVDTLQSIQDALFCVHLTRQYSASRELSVFLDNYNGDRRKITDESELKYLQALEVSTSTYLAL